MMFVDWGQAFVVPVAVTRELLDLKNRIYGNCDHTSIIWQYLCHILFQMSTVAVSVVTRNNSIAFPSGRWVNAAWPHHLSAFKPCVHRWHITQMLLFISWHWLFAEWGMASRNLRSIPEDRCINLGAGTAIVSLLAYNMAQKLRTSLCICLFWSVFLFKSGAQWGNFVFYIYCTLLSSLKCFLRATQATTLHDMNEKWCF